MFIYDNARQFFFTILAQKALQVHPSAAKRRSYVNDALSSLAAVLYLRELISSWQPRCRNR